MTETLPSILRGIPHAMLPEAFSNDNEEKPAKFADVAALAFVAERERAARVPEGGGGAGLRIGARNGTAVVKMLKRTRFEAVAQNMGATKGRALQEGRWLCSLAS